MRESPATRDLARVCKGMGNPIRWHILLLLRTGHCSVSGLVEGLGLEQSKVSKHLLVLLNAGLVRVEVEGRQHCYHLTQPRLIGRILDSLGALREQHGTRSKL